MSDSSAGNPLPYATYTGVMSFDRHEADSGVSFTAKSKGWNLALLIGLIVVPVLIVPIPVLVRSAMEQPTWRYAMKPLVGVVACAAFALLVVIVLKRLWERRNVPVCVSLVGDRLTVIHPDRSVLRSEYPVQDIAEIVSKTAGVGVTLQRVGDLTLRLRSGKEHILLHAYPMHDVRAIAQELQQRIACAV